VVLLEGELAAIKDEDRQRTRLLGDMAAQRDRWDAQHSDAVLPRINLLVLSRLYLRHFLLSGGS
jgi:hypothetical protein